METDFGLLVDFVRGEIDSSAAANVRSRLETDAAFFDRFQRLKRTYAVIRSLPAMTGESERAEAFAGAVRREFEARDWMSLLPCIEGSDGLIRALRTEFFVRAIFASIPRLQPSVAFAAALREQFGVRARTSSVPQVAARAAWVGAMRREFEMRTKVASLPHLAPRPEFVAACRKAVAREATTTTIPEILVRPEFQRRLQVALFEEAQKEKLVAPEPALPQVVPADPFRRRLFKTILLSSRRRVRDVPTRTDPSEYQWGRELKRGLQRSHNSMAFTMAMHALAVVIMLFIFTRPEALGQGTATISLGKGDVLATPAMPGEREVDATPSTAVGDGKMRTTDDRPSADDAMDFQGMDQPDPDHTLQVPDGADEFPDSETLAYEGGQTLDGVPAYFRLRTLPKARKAEYVGSDELYGVLDRALAYLRIFQTADGCWWVVDVPANQRTTSADLREVQEIEMTSAALLAFLGDGHSSEHSPIGYAGNVRLGINWLLRHQRESGQIGPTHLQNVMIHAMATLALAENYGFTRSPALRDPLRKACEWLSTVQAHQGSFSESRDGFPFKVEESASLTTSVWAYMALATARHVGVPPTNLPQERIDAFLRWFEVAPRYVDLLADQKEINARGNLLPAAAGAALCLFAQEEGSVLRFDSRRKEYVKRVAGEEPDLNGAPASDRNDSRYLFFGSLAMALHQQQGGERAAAWNKKLADTLIANQMPQGGFAPKDEYGQIYGNIYATAFAALSIENAYRVNLLTR